MVSDSQVSPEAVASKAVASDTAALSVGAANVGEPVNSVRSSVRRARERVGFNEAAFIGLRRHARQIMALFDDLQSLSAVQKAGLKSSLRGSINIVAVLNYRNEVALKRAMIVFMPVVLVIFIGSPLIVNAWLRRAYSGWGWSGLFAVYFIELMLLYSVVYGPSFLMSQRPRRRFPNLTMAYGMVFGWAVCATLGIGLLVLNYRQVLNMPLLSPTLQVLLVHVHYATLFSLSAVLLLFTALAIFLAAHYAIFQRDFERRYADAMIVIELLDLLDKIEKHENEWNELAFKRSTVHILEKIANRVAHDLPSQLRSGDAPTDAWFRGTAARIAAALREKKKWILLPKADSRAYLLDHLKEDFIKSANGNWDGVSRADPQALSARNALMLARETAINLIRGALPLAALLLVHRGLGLLSDEVFDSLLIGAVLWFILTLLMEIDPLFKEKISTLKDVIGLVH